MVTIQIPARPNIIKILNQQHIEVSGLTFRFVQLPTPDMRQAYQTALHSAAIQRFNMRLKCGVWGGISEHENGNGSLMRILPLQVL